MKRASDVPPVVESAGFRPVTSAIALATRSVNGPGSTTNTSALEGSHSKAKRILPSAAFSARWSLTAWASVAEARQKMNVIVQKDSGSYVIHLEHSKHAAVRAQRGIEVATQPCSLRIAASSRRRPLARKGQRRGAGCVLRSVNVSCWPTYPSPAHARTQKQAIPRGHILQQLAGVIPKRLHGGCKERPRKQFSGASASALLCPRPAGTKAHAILNWGAPQRAGNALTLRTWPAAGAHAERSYGGLLMDH